MQLVLASNNAHKAEEFSRVLSPLGYTVMTQRQAGVEIEVEENGTTFAENAKLKAEAVYRLTGLPTVADDSGLEVDALGNAPGIYSARYGGADITDADRCRKLLQELSDLPLEQRTARFVCVLYYLDENGIGHTVRGECHGLIGYAPRGENGFGYDPIFMVGDQSFAELTAEQKDRISHRGKALELFVKQLEEK